LKTPVRRSCSARCSRGEDIGKASLDARHAHRHHREGIGSRAEKPYP
jgi:hypothetical protein